MKESPNKWVGRYGNKPEAIVIHITQGSFEGAFSWLTNPKSFVSSHFLISEEGKVEQLVKCEDAAWHAGVVKNPKWKLLKRKTNPNLYTIGIENAGFVSVKPSLKQFMALVDLVRELCQKYKIPCDKDHVIPHNWIRSDKSCPGPWFDCEKIIWLANLT